VPSGIPPCAAAATAARTPDPAAMHHRDRGRSRDPLRASGMHS